MRVLIDTKQATLEVSTATQTESFSLYSKRALELLSELWIKVEWNGLHWQSFSWLGVPIWQLPEDLLRLQEVLFQLAPDVIVETGVNQGGSAIFLASICELLGSGRVISVDVRIPDRVRQELASHRLGSRITLIEGNSVAMETVEAVCREIGPKERVFVFLDSDHSRDHVAAELELYAPLISVGSYIVACDGVMRLLADTPGGDPNWMHDNPAVAAREFADRHREFALERPRAQLGDDHVISAMTYWPEAWLKRVAG